jgi:hypothetical protein
MLLVAHGEVWKKRSNVPPLNKQMKFMEGFFLIRYLPKNILQLLIRTLNSIGWFHFLEIA